MIVDFSKLDLRDRPTLILKNANDRPLGVLGYAYNIDFEANYNELSILQFNVPSKADNEDVPCYEDLIGMRIIELENIGNFTLITPTERNDGINKYKECQAYSLEYEFSYKKITVANDTYKFWDNNPSKRHRTILGMIIDLMPSWTVTKVSTTLIDKYRTFEVNNENLYNFIKSTIQQAYGCIFDFNTLDRTIEIRDIDEEATIEPVYLSMDNLLKEFEIQEDTENMITRLDVSGSDGVDIRDVNPTGTNNIINLDYYMTDKNFSNEIIEKYRAWKTICNNNRALYFSKSVKYTVLTMQVGVERAALTDLEGELTSLDNQRAVIIQAISQGISTQSDLNNANAEYNAKLNEINAKNTTISNLETERSTILEELKGIVNNCSFNQYFSREEVMELDRYIRDGEINEPSFVSTTVAYSDDGIKLTMNNAQISITDATVEQTSDSSGTIVSIKGGQILLSSFGNANIISAVLSYDSSNSMVFTASLSNGMINGNSFDSGSLTFSGSISGNKTVTSDSVSINVNAFLYFTLNPGEYQRRSVAWDLFEYGEKIAEKLSQPTFSFSVNCANFFAVEQFEEFKNHLRLGGKIYLDNDGETLKPICIGAHCNFEDLTMLELKFSDSFVRNGAEFKLADILEQSVSTGRTVDAGKFNYEEFSKSGANTSINEFMKSAIDLSKNRILDSRQQAISMDGAGLRLRKWANEAESSYEDEQIWMNNNSVLMTDDNWQTAKMAIGKFKDPNFGNDLWGILAPTIVGTLLAGEQLVIESKKNDGSGDVLMFRVDGDGCRMYNGDISVIGDVGTVWTYDVRSDTDIYSDMNTSSTRVATAVKGAVVIATKRLRDSGGILWGYVIAHDSSIGWMQLVNCTARSEQGETGRKHIVLHPDIGIVVGKYPVVSNDGSGNYHLNTDNASMWIDTVGNMHLNGYATFNSLSTPGQTNIDGGNIKTGTIDADLVDVVNLNANNIKAGTIDGGNVNAKLLNIVDKDNNVIASFRDTVILGNSNGAHTQIDSNSFEIYSASRQLIAAIGNSNDSNGSALITEQFIGTGLSPAYFRLNCVIYRINSVRVNGTEASYTRINYHDIQVISPLPNKGDIVAIDYSTVDEIPYYVLGKQLGNTYNGLYSFLEGYETQAPGPYSHAEGKSTKALGQYSHAEGYDTQANDAAHAEGYNTYARGFASHAEGLETGALSDFQHVFGKYNITDNQDEFAEIVGNGSSTKKWNARTLDWDGNEWINGVLAQASDARLKTECGKIPDVSSIPARRFRWNDNKINHDYKEHIGYYAQDVEAVAPYLVDEDAMGYKSLDYIGLLVAKIDSLEKRVAELEERIAS